MCCGVTINCECPDVRREEECSRSRPRPLPVGELEPGGALRATRESNVNCGRKTVAPGQSWNGTKSSPDTMKSCRSESAAVSTFQCEGFAAVTR